ncbi:MAG TPA: hypothetical protein VLA88_00515 [Candidatus Saccharimonadales bacterium]|nr:hypothetical protein [Candidatus Saccharimonadales bacterium]
MAETLTQHTPERLAVPDTVEELMKIWDDEPYARIGSNEPYKVGEDDGTKEERERVKTAFIAGEIENPEVTYPHLDGEALQAAHDRMVDLYERAEQLPDSIDKDLARELMRKKILEVDRHIEIVCAWGTEDPGERQEHLDKAAELQMTVFGSPEQDHFDSLLDETRTKAEAIVALGKDDEVQAIAAELLELTGDRKEPEGFMKPGLTQHAREVLKRDIQVRFGERLFLPPESGGKMPHEEAVRHFQEMQDLTGMIGWHTRLTDGNAAETTRRDKSVDIGRGRAQFTGASLRHKELHEVRGHGLRGYNGDLLAEGTSQIAALVRSSMAFSGMQHPGTRGEGLPMARYALPGSLDFEEGMLTALEQIDSDSPATPGRIYYLAAGLMLGMDRDGDKRDFRGAYEIMWRRSVIEAATSGKKVDTEKSKSAAYQSMMRMTRGGALDTRDLAYYRGYVKASGYLNSLAELSDRDRSMEWGYMMCAQFDPTNPLHAKYIRRGYDLANVYKQL